MNIILMTSFLGVLSVTSLHLQSNTQRKHQQTSVSLSCVLLKYLVSAMRWQCCSLVTVCDVSVNMCSCFECVCFAAVV